MRTTTLLIAVALLAACGGDDDASTSGPDAAEPSVTARATDTDTDTDTARGDGEPVVLPDSFPTEIPVPADIELDNAEEHVGDGSTIFEVTGWYDGDPIRVARDYEQVLQDLGFEITSRTESPDNLYFVAENDAWYISAGFFPDPVRNVGASVGVTVAPAG